MADELFGELQRRKVFKVGAAYAVVAWLAVQGASIAVLPFLNLSADPAQAFFSDGLSVDLITSLSQLGGLKVISRSSSFHFRDSKDDARTIGTALGVARLLSGHAEGSGPGRGRAHAAAPDQDPWRAGGVPGCRGLRGARRRGPGVHLAGHGLGNA